MLLGYETSKRSTSTGTTRRPGAGNESIAEARNRGLHAIRFEFIVRLLQMNSQIVTLSIYWDGGREFSRCPNIEDVRRRLVYNGGSLVSGEFEDSWVVRYETDPDARERVLEVLDRMVGSINPGGQKVPA